MRTGEPVLNLPQPSSFPARISLRPNMTYEADHGKIELLRKFKILKILKILKFMISSPSVDKIT